MSISQNMRTEPGNAGNPFSVHPAQGRPPGYLLLTDELHFSVAHGHTQIQPVVLNSMAGGRQLSFTLVKCE